MENVEIKFNNLCNWMSTNGGFVNPKLSLINGQFGRTVIANQKIENEDIFTLPKNLVLNHENCDLNIEGDQFKHRDLTVISLLKEYYKPNSFWKDYLNLLPSLSEFKEHPLVIYIKGNFPTVSESIYNKVQNLNNEFTSLYDKLIEINNQHKIVESFTKEDLLWAFLITSTRMWTGFGLVPFADLLQHSNNSNMILSDRDSNLFMMTDYIGEGEEVFDNYALNDDITLFVNFGFVESSNTAVVSINFIFEETILDGLKSSILNRRKLLPMNISSLGINQNLMRFIRLNLIDESDLKLVNLSDEELGNSMISLENELRCLKKVKNRSNYFLTENEIKFIQSDRDSLSDIEKQIFDLLSKVNNLKVQINQFVNNYWISLLGDTSY
jgi:hypothetical protein